MHIQINGTESSSEIDLYMVVGFFIQLPQQFKGISVITAIEKGSFSRSGAKTTKCLYGKKNEPQPWSKSKYTNPFKMTHRPNCKNQTAKPLGDDVRKYLCSLGADRTMKIIIIKGKRIRYI